MSTNVTTSRHPLAIK